MLQLTEEATFAAWVLQNSRGISFGPSTVLVTRDLQEAKEFSDRGGTILFVAKEVKEYGRFSRACGTGHSIFKLYERSTLAHWHSFLWAADPEGQEPFSEVPKEQAGAFRIVIRSAKQAGGTWFSWNLLETLTQHGVSVEWNGVATDNPLPIWLHRADPRIHLSIQEGTRKKIQIIDASGTSEPVEGDLIVVVTDGDPAKVIPDGGTEFVLNRNPHGIAMYSESTVAMQTGKAVALTNPALDEWLWSWYQKVRGLKEPVDIAQAQTSVVLDESLTSPKPTKPDATFSFRDKKEPIDGFDFSDEEKGFDFNA